jgi:hypothetical protein
VEWGYRIIGPFIHRAIGANFDFVFEANLTLSAYARANCSVPGL